MSRHRRRFDPLSKVLPEDPPPTRWERVEIWLELAGFSVLIVSAMIAAAWGAIRYAIGMI